MAGEDVFGLSDLASYLGRDARELEKLAERGHLPGRRVGGQWQFHRENVHHWLERQLSEYSDQELERLEFSVGQKEEESASPLVVTPLLSVETIEVPLGARTARSVLSRMVEVANRTWLLYLADDILQAIEAREKLSSTALPGGVAIPHPRRPLPDALGESLIAFGRTATGIPFDRDGSMTDLFFLVLCRDHSTHLHVLARLSRIFQREDFFDQLRATQSATEAFEVITKAEMEVVDASVS
ncbi:PTS system fructose-specific EIIABC component [Planctomycetes bacterium Pan216]|uniref:PTS system fructose-specific EIIABC component n=1 Tax=Kolteria novifilia TaxID=2527975 RepID=A0A518BC55_9BACT|nr:PTS system fructose-specific EIIABC component [Planctomycetes bacterium Pan216]